MPEETSTTTAPDVTVPADPPDGRATLTKEVRKSLDQVREALKKNQSGLERIDQIEKDLQERKVSDTAAREELQQLKDAQEEFQRALDDAKKRDRVHRIGGEGLNTRRGAIEMLGMMGRQLLSRHIGAEIPEQFAGERVLLESYNSRAAAVRATLSADAAGGSGFVPTIIESEVFDTLEMVSDFLAETDFNAGLPGNVNLVTLTGRPTLQPKRATVDTDMTQSDAAFGEVQFRPDEAYIFFPVDNRLLQMAPYDLGKYLMGLLVESGMEGLVDWVFNADGTSSYNSITGLLNETTAGYLNVMATGKNTFAETAFTDVAATVGKCLKRGRARGKWTMAYDILYTVFGELDRTGKVPVVTFDAQGNPLVLGKPVIIEESMPALADSAASTILALFGDPATVFVGLQGGMQLAASTEVLWKRNQTGFKNLMNVDIKRKPSATMIGLKTAAT